MNDPGSLNGFDPLQVPGGVDPNADNIVGPQRLRPGEFAVAAIENTAFFNQRPGPEAEADKLLKRGTSMKIINTSGSFHRVELDSGEVGFVPSVMVEAANAAPLEDVSTTIETITGSGPPEPVPPLPDGLPSDFIPDVEPAPEPAPEPATPDI